MDKLDCTTIWVFNAKDVTILDLTVIRVYSTEVRTRNIGDHHHRNHRSQDEETGLGRWRNQKYRNNSDVDKIE